MSRTRPRRPYKNFRIFCLAHGSDQGRLYPCLACRGHGSIYDPTDPPCPVEGNRYRRTIRCEQCEGSGRGTKEACLQAYRQVVEACRQAQAEYDRIAQVRKAALARLTSEETNALRELGV